MSKKKFTYGLESLFDNSDDHLMTATALPKASAMSSHASDTEPNSKRPAGKNFTADLDSLFHDALRETVEEQLKKSIGVNELPPETGRSVVKTLSGLDALIRSTADEEETPQSYKPTKRVTFVFDNSKLEKLKHIARKERAFLKDILNEIITGYINDYDRNNDLA